MDCFEAKKNLRFLWRACGVTGRIDSEVAAARRVRSTIIIIIVINVIIIMIINIYVLLYY